MSLGKRVMWLIARRFAIYSDGVHARVDAGRTRFDSRPTAGRFSEAFKIYRDDLASSGDRFDQYMIGFMHLNSLGTAPDPSKAAAWLKLAAEREDEDLVELRDRIWTQLNNPLNPCTAIRLSPCASSEDAVSVPNSAF